MKTHFVLIQGYPYLHSPYSKIKKNEHNVKLNCIFHPNEYQQFEMYGCQFSVRVHRYTSSCDYVRVHQYTSSCDLLDQSLGQITLHNTRSWFIAQVVVYSSALSEAAV